MKNVCYLFLLMLMVSSCKKDDPQPVESSSAPTPVFAATGSINGVPISLQAGGGGYFMSTSYSLDANGVYDFIGELKPGTCTSNCPNSLKITIKDYRPYSTFVTNIDSSLVPGYYSFAALGGTASSFSQVFVGLLQTGIAKTYSWNFGDGSKVESFSPSVTHIYRHPGVYRVSLSIESTTGCISTISNDVQFGQTGNSFLPQFQTTINGDTATFFPIPIGGSYPFTYSWNFGDGATSDEFNPSHEYAAPGVYKTSLTMTDAIGTSSTQNANVSIKNNSLCASLFIAPTPTPLSNPLNLGNIVVEWTDAQGKVWASDNSQQSSKSSFKIISVDDYLNDPTGGATKKIHVQFSCTLYKGFESISLKNIDATFSIGYK